MRAILPHIVLISLLFLTGCDVFSTRSPELPTGEGGTYLQPDTPEVVIQNLQAAIAELNTLNYNRSLSEDLAFRPTDSAQQQDASIWAGWTRNEEERYFSTLVAAAQNNSGHRLDLNDRDFTILGENSYELKAQYVLTINHRRADVPTAVQGLLVWLLVQDTDGLWRIQAWTDQEIAGAPSWSDLKAAFAK